MRCRKAIATLEEKRQINELLKMTGPMMAPASSMMFALSHDNPINFVGPKLGETVVDLGCGSGVDVVLAACKVGQTGLAIGIDTDSSEIKMARTVAAGLGLLDKNVNFYVQDMRNLQLPRGSADVAVSSHAILFCAERLGVVYKEAFQILKPGGRIGVTDFLHHSVRSSEEYLELVYEAGFRRIRILTYYEEGEGRFKTGSMRFTAMKPKQ